MDADLDQQLCWDYCDVPVCDRPSNSESDKGVLDKTDAMIWKGVKLGGYTQRTAHPIDFNGVDQYLQAETNPL